MSGRVKCPGEYVRGGNVQEECPDPWNTTPVSFKSLSRTNPVQTAMSKF